MTDATIYHVICGVLVLGVLAGISMMSKVATAVRGNALSAVCMAAAIMLTLYHNNIVSLPGLWVCMTVSLAAGLFWASRIRMIDMPQVVALLNGFGGAASALVAVMTLRSGAELDSFALVTGGLALVVGTVTLVGSLIAAGKLHKVLSQRPVVWPMHQTITTVLLMLSVCSIILVAVKPEMVITAILLGAVASTLFGIAFAVRVGGADMPITISLLNSLSGVAGSIAGMAIGDQLLVAIGGIVGASGLLLTQIMCRAMNRSLPDILLGKTTARIGAAGPKKPSASPASAPAAATGTAALPEILQNAQRVIIIPGYGMALAQAQQQVAQLAEKLEHKGATIDFAIHPVAGRMPGHMNVLLAEANVPYEKLREMDDINGEFANCDVAIIVGANDVVNPAANTAEGTPIYSMPVLNADQAKHVIVCNFDRKPGYAGVDNPLYDQANTTLLLGDAADTVRELMTALDSKQATAPATAENNTASILQKAQRVIIIPGYGMALAQAQQQVAQLAEKLEHKGATVDFAIHPVAGRMPGHMNVLLAEANVPYEKLREMDDINGEFANCDVAIIVGANDVVNPAANTAEGTPIYGMPVLNADQAKHVIVCNFDRKPGYAGVDNPLYDQANATLLLGDAADTVRELMTALDAAPCPTTSTSSGSGNGLHSILRDAKRVIIVPGYGMALAQAQQHVAQLAERLEERNRATVDFAIHPVAGRMPGHMNVLLAEANVPYEKLREMDDINDEFANCDVAIIVGANDVVNPAANTAEGTPIYGMPVLNADKAKHVVICNFDRNPGYAGVDNPLYEMPNAVLLLGDAADTVRELMDTCQE